MKARAIVLLERDGSDAARWTLAAAIVLAAYLGLMATYLLLVSHKPRGAPETPAIIIDMAPMPVAPASPVDVAPGPEMMEAMPPPDPIVEPTPPEPVIEPPPPAPVEAVVALPEPPPQQPPEVKEEPTPEKPLEKKPVRKKPAPRTTAQPRSDRDTADTPASPRAGSTAAAISSWRDQVISQLQRAKRYPSGAESRREQGVVTLSFTLSRGGSVLGRSIARGSGYPELDQEVLAMVSRAQPFPAFPAGMNQSSVNLSVPIRFSVR